MFCVRLPSVDDAEVLIAEVLMGILQLVPCVYLNRGTSRFYCDIQAY